MKAYFEKKKEVHNKSLVEPPHHHDVIMEKNFSSIVALEEEFRKNKLDFLSGKANNKFDNSKISNHEIEETTDEIETKDLSSILKNIKID